ncbi:spore germination protein [Paenibacillus tarimensis]
MKITNKRYGQKEHHLGLPEIPNEPLSGNLSDNEAALRQIFANSSDFYVRPVTFFQSVPGQIVYLRILVDSGGMDKSLLEPLTKHKDDFEYESPSQFIEQLKNESLAVAQATIVSKLGETAQLIAEGHTILMVDSSMEAIAVKLVNNQFNRQLEEPATEALIRGPHIGFIENIDMNIALIRKRVRIPHLKMEMLSAGKVTKTPVAMAYIEHLASPSVIEEMRKRLLKIDVDIILESGHIEELISDNPFSPFPTMQMSERPDTVAALLLDGKVAVLVDGTPMALVAPSTFWQGFQTVEDYYTSYIFGTLIRWLRYLFAFLALLLPSIYIAITTFHPEMIPTSLVLSIAASREIAPFPALVETLMMEVAFEGLREAGVRLPRPVGQTISIVGALVIGEAAVMAGIISAPIVIIVSLTGIASFLIPKINMSQAIRLSRFPMMLLAGSFGLYGIGAGIIALLIHLVNLRSFGVPYMFPVAPFHASGIWDVLLRAPWKMLNKRQQ